MKPETIKIPDILLPAAADMTAWAVNACDQFTSDCGYWKQVEHYVGEKLSTLNLVFPEIYLNDNAEARIRKINAAMQSYIDGGVFKEYRDSLILVERTTQSGTRTGIVLAVDLEDYSFENGAATPIRSTEDTILERIPPRVKIRANAPIELPHVMLLYEDELNRVLNTAKRGEVVYDFELNMNGGHVKGTLLQNPEEVVESFYSLPSVKSGGLLFAVGDGNHSLATAKTCWEELKKTLSETEIKTHPARYALCEAVNVFDNALSFEPIHRLVKTDKIQQFTDGLITEGEKTAYLVVNGERRKIAFNGDIADGIRKLDGYISDFLKKFGGEVDYIHGDGELERFTQDGGVGIILPAIAKNDFFNRVAVGGNLPRKTFSMGEGEEKRYYIEAKRIK